MRGECKLDSQRPEHEHPYLGQDRIQDLTLIPLKKAYRHVFSRRGTISEGALTVSEGETSPWRDPLRPTICVRLPLDRPLPGVRTGSKRDRASAEAYVYHGHSQQEIAVHLALPYSTVSSVVQRETLNSRSKPDPPASRTHLSVEPEKMFEISDVLVYVSPYSKLLYGRVRTRDFESGLRMQRSAALNSEVRGTSEQRVSLRLGVPGGRRGGLRFSQAD